MIVLLYSTVYSHYIVTQLQTVGPTVKYEVFKIVKTANLSCSKPFFLPLGLPYHVSKIHITKYMSGAI